MEDKKNLKIIGGILIGAIVIGASIIGAGAIKDVISSKEGK